MSPPPSTSESCPSDYVGSLPLELFLYVLNHLPLEDIYSLTRASPGARFYLNGHRLRILRRLMSIVHDHYVESGLIQLAFYAMRLRVIRAQFHNHTIPQIEEQVKPVLISIILLDFNHPNDCRQLSMPALVAAMNLFSEMCDAFLAYREQRPSFVSEMPEFREIQRPRLSLEDAPREARHAFIDSFLRFDCFRNIFYHSRSYMLTDMKGEREMFLKPFSPVVYNMSFPRYDIPRFIHGFHKNIISGALDARLETISSERDRETVCPQGFRFPHRMLARKTYYLYNLYIQGFPLLLYLKKLPHQALQEYTVREFCETVRSMPPEDLNCQDSAKYDELRKGWR
ncbi:hypothetical protein ACHAPJ_010099 [Fusarium lateritium]